MVSRPVPVQWWSVPVPRPLNEAVGLAVSMSMTVGVAMHMTAPAVIAMTVDMTAMTVGVVAVSVAMNAGMAVPLRMNVDFGLVAINQCHTGDYADRNPDRQHALVIGPRRRRGQNSDEKRCEEESTHLVSCFCEAWKPYVIWRPQSTGSSRIDELPAGNPVEGVRGSRTIRVQFPPSRFALRSGPSRASPARPAGRRRRRPFPANGGARLARPEG